MTTGLRRALRRLRRSTCHPLFTPGAMAVRYPRVYWQARWTYASGPWRNLGARLVL